MRKNEHELAEGSIIVRAIKNITAQEDEKVLMKMESANTPVKVT